MHGSAWTAPKLQQVRQQGLQAAMGGRQPCMCFRGSTAAGPARFGSDRTAVAALAADAAAAVGGSQGLAAAPQVSEPVMASSSSVGGPSTSGSGAPQLPVPGCCQALEPH
mmetsp:Transcript_28460/g.62639  ORF Transcript_28460/g.62639 Transcript_28460/m.62639 type:complete len:110 (+) Transcript_28460:164-493(+)